MLEKRIENILRISPELLDPSFIKCPVETQMVRGASRLDLMVHTRKGSVIIEIKKTVLSPANVRQLLAYCRKWSLDSKLKLKHDAYLVGFRPLNENPLMEAAAKSLFRIHYRYIGEHVPAYVKAKKGGGYEPWCENCGEKAIKLFG